MGTYVLSARYKTRPSANFENGLNANDKLGLYLTTFISFDILWAIWAARLKFISRDRRSLASMLHIMLCISLWRLSFPELWSQLPDQMLQDNVLCVWTIAELKELAAVNLMYSFHYGRWARLPRKFFGGAIEGLQPSERPFSPSNSLRRGTKCVVMSRSGQK